MAQSPSCDTSLSMPALGSELNDGVCPRAPFRWPYTSQSPRGVAPPLQEPSSTLPNMEDARLPLGTAVILHPRVASINPCYGGVRASQMGTLRPQIMISEDTQQIWDKQAKSPAPAPPLCSSTAIL